MLSKFLRIFSETTAESDTAWLPSLGPSSRYPTANPPGAPHAGGFAIGVKLGDGAWLQICHQADVGGLGDEVVLATRQILHVPVVVLFVGGGDRLVLVLLETTGPDAQRLDVVIAQRQ